MKTKLILILLILAACTSQTTQTVNELDEKRWQEPRTLSLIAITGPFEVTFYPNNQTNELIISNEITNDLRNLNAIILENQTNEKIESIESFAQRNNLQLQR
jgi:hypothetical protein